MASRRDVPRSGEVEASLDGDMDHTAALLAQQEATLDHLVSGLLGKLMGVRHCLSDGELSTSIDELLNSEACAKIASMDNFVTKPLYSPSDPDADVQRYWEKLQKSPFLADAEVRVDLGAVPDACFAAGVEANDGAPPAEQFLDLPVQPSRFYVPRRQRGTPGGDEDWDPDDDYHDDDDPGYRIREIFEAELLAELSQKMDVSHSPGAGVDELASCASPEQGDPQRGDGHGEGFAASGAPGVPGAPLTAWGGDAFVADPSAAGETLLPDAGFAGLQTGTGEARSSSPRFGGQGAPDGTGIGEGHSRLSSSQAGPDRDDRRGEIFRQPVEDFTEEELQQRQEERRRRYQRHVQYAPSGDRFYPVEMDGVVYDSFSLRVVFERDKTGFEESKEFPIRMGTVVAARYQIMEYLGSAAFSRAVQCLDLDTNKMVCMKIIKNDKDFFDQSLDEIKLLRYININGDVDERCVLRLYDYFYHKEHLIIITELLRDNLYEFSKFNRESGEEPYFTLGRLQKISKQVLTALDYVHNLRLMHCDLKPENILIRSYSRCEIKVIDFGSSCFVDDHLSSYVQSRSYRAPEVMLGCPYDQKIDLWSLGCIIAELWTGYVLFQNDSVQSLLARILGIIGDFPYHLMTRGRFVPQYFTQDGQLYQEIEGPGCPERGRRLHLLVPKKSSLQQRMRTDCAEFLDFLTQMLQLDPAKRPTAAEALEHPFLTQCRFVDGC